MDNTLYSTAAWRSLPRTDCIVHRLLGDAASDCSGLIHRHHTNPEDPYSRTVEVCAGHHSMLHKALRALEKPKKRCPHRHTSRESRELCEARLNRAA